MVTTIQLNENVKNALDRLKSNKETYEEVILNLMKTAEKCKRDQEELLIEGCKVMAKDMIEINKVWEAADSDIDWEWKTNNGNKKRGHSAS
jgi:hypothetical protein